MLSFLKIKNIVLLDDLSINFGSGLTLLTGETGSGKSIIVDALGALTGDRVSSELIKRGSTSASIEGVFNAVLSPRMRSVIEDAGFATSDGETELIIRRDLSASGRNRIFLNDQLISQSLLKSIGRSLVDIHGQGDQASLFETRTHLAMLDSLIPDASVIDRTRSDFEALASARLELELLESDASEKLQLIDVLTFQTNEIEALDLKIGEDVELEDEKLRLANIEKLTALTGEVFSLLYESETSAGSTLERAARRIAELSEFTHDFDDYREGMSTAKAVIEDLAVSIRDFRARLNFSPGRLDEIEDRLSQIARLERKYGPSIEAVLEHAAASRGRLSAIESSELREKELRSLVAERTEYYLASARALHDARRAAANELERRVEEELKAVALERAAFVVKVDSLAAEPLSYSARGFDKVEFYFSANPGEPPKPLAKIASGGEASRLMLVLKTVSIAAEYGKTAIFDEIDAGIGGRVAAAVGRRLKKLGQTQQVLCVTHQPQIASLADHHYVVRKRLVDNSTSVEVVEADHAERVEEIARMLAGEHVTDEARDNARTLISTESQDAGKTKRARN